MSDSPTAVDGAATAPDAPLSPGARILAVFARPYRAWGGLEEHIEWWIPTLILSLISMASALLLHDRAMMPMLEEKWEQMVADGKMTQQGIESGEAFLRSPMGLSMFAVQPMIVTFAIVLLSAFVIWVGVSFVLGGKLRFRLALEVSAWSSLVKVPELILLFVLAWYKQTYEGVHTGFGAFLPDADRPSKLMLGLGVVLDALGPLGLWAIVVGIIGAAVLSGAPRKSVAWTLGALNLLLILFFAGLVAAFGPGA